MSLEPVHFRGCCVPFSALDRRDGAIGSPRAASEASGRTGKDASGATGEDMGGATGETATAGGGDARAVAGSGEVKSR